MNKITMPISNYTFCFMHKSQACFSSPRKKERKKINSLIHAHGPMDLSSFNLCNKDGGDTQDCQCLTQDSRCRPHDYLFMSNKAGPSILCP
jgi:hypothetical protein